MSATGHPHRLLPGWLRELTRLATLLGVLFVARGSLADHYVVPSGSMEPTVMTGDRILVDKSAFGWRVPGTDTWLGSVELPPRGAIVVLDPPFEGPVLLKRVVAHPGDRVVVRAGRLALDGHPVPTEFDGDRQVEHLGGPHVIRTANGGGPDFGPVMVPEGTLLVLGDNRGNSHDGRSFGFVSIEKLRGRAIASYVRDGQLGWWGL